MAESLNPPMSRALRGCLLALVLLNLVFVQISSGVGTHWMVPMFVLTALSPLLTRMHASLIYRTVWNAGVLAIFALLVRDGAQTGVRYLLEDGLILAAFCQVHLLNNLGPRQKPDLLFFNSFLIALVTSFFCQDLAFATVFALYAFALVLSLQLTAARGRGRPTGMLADGAGKAVFALVATMLVFMVWPRDFTREGLVEETLRGSGMLEVGFTEQVELGRSGKTVVSNRVVMRARLLEGRARDVPMYWRGASFVWYDGKRWHPDDQPQAARPDLRRPWLQPRQGRLVRRAENTTARVAVELEEPEHRRLFFPLSSHQLDVRGAEQGMFLMPRSDGSVKFVTSRDFDDSRVLRYELRLHAPERDRGDAPRHLNSPVSATHLVATHGLPQRGLELATRLAAEHRGAPQHRVVRAMERYLAETLHYLLPGTQGAARTLDGFLAGDGGHCEYFATTLALMLRSQGIPCRLVTGFLSNEWDESRAVLTVRSKHAHAWVEVLDPAGHWYAADPSPAADLDDDASETSWWASFGTMLSEWWDQVAAFDDEARAAALAWLSELPGRTLSWVRAHPFGAAGLGAALLALLAWWRRRRTPGPPAVRTYLVAVGRAGLQPRPGETPRELLERARAADVKERTLAQLTQATETHERERYG